MERPRIIVVVGPTASGKSARALDLARQHSGEIINGDSRQLYRDMIIGTASPILDEQGEVEGIPHHLYNFVDPRDSFSVAQYVEVGHQKIGEVLSRGKTPIIVGGTGFYIDSLVKGAVFSQTPIDETLREKLSNTDLVDLQNQLQELSGEVFAATDVQNKRRVVRALERLLLGQDDVVYTHPYDVTYIGCEVVKDVLKERITQRTHNMIAGGLEDEVRNVFKKYGNTSVAGTTIGYQEWTAYFAGEKSREQIVEDIILATVQYAKRQMTWFKKNKEIVWH